MNNLTQFNKNYLKSLILFLLMALSTWASAQINCNPQVAGGPYCTFSSIAFQANAPGTDQWLWDMGDGSTLNVRDPDYIYTATGTYTVTLTATNTILNQSCTKTITVEVKPSPEIRWTIQDPLTQCFEGNTINFCDSSRALGGKTIESIRWIWDDGDNYTFIKDSNFCKTKLPGAPNPDGVSFTNENGGKFGFSIEVVDNEGCVAKEQFDDVVTIWPKLGIRFTSDQPTECDSTLATIINQSRIPYDSVETFIFDFGDTQIVVGGGDTNKDYWFGPNNDYIIKKWYYGNGTFDAKLYVKATFGCEETYENKATATNVRESPFIIADFDSSCTGQPGEINLSIGGISEGANISSFLWEFGDPPAGPNNFENQSLNPAYGYGTGVWMPRFQVQVGPCFREVYDTIIRFGPGSTIEVPDQDFIPEDIRYQCVIRDTVHFPNNSSFFGNDDYWFDDILQFVNDTNDYYKDLMYLSLEYKNIDSLNPTCSDDDKFEVNVQEKFENAIFAKIDGANTTVVEFKDSFYVVYNQIGASFTTDTVRMWRDSIFLIDIDTIFFENESELFKITDATLSSWLSNTANPITNFDKTYDSTGNFQNIYLRTRFDVDKLKTQFWFNWVPVPGTTGTPNPNIPGGVPDPGNQKSLPYYRPEVYDDHVIRLWEFADQFAPQCTTNSEINKNVGLNCAFTRDSAPSHWYTPWDRIYKAYRNGQFYGQPAERVLLSKSNGACYTVNVFPYRSYRIENDTLLVVPLGDTLNFGPYKIGPNTPNHYYAKDTSGREALHARLLRPDSVIKGPIITSVLDKDQDFFVPAGLTLNIINWENQTTRTVVGGGIRTLEFGDQFELKTSCDSVIPQKNAYITQGRTITATPSGYFQDTVLLINGLLVDTAIQASKIFVDSAYHRDYFYQENANCFTVQLNQRDSVLENKGIGTGVCESIATVQLALSPPNAKGLTWEAGIPCPTEPSSGGLYNLEFSMSQTKPGCSQQWFEVNYDTLQGVDNWVNYKSGEISAPPRDNPTPLPFVLPYSTILTWGTRWVKGYSPEEIGNDPRERPDGSFGLGLIIGNGAPQFNGNTPIAPECTDTAFYGDMFRIRFMSADFQILKPDNDPTYLCAGDTLVVIPDYYYQDSISSISWNWGMPFPQGVFRGYFEQINYMKDYFGPQPGRNDENLDYTRQPNEKKWLYNYAVRVNQDDVNPQEIIDTLVTRVFRDYEKVDIPRRDVQIIIRDIFLDAGIDYYSIPADELSLYVDTIPGVCLFIQPDAYKDLFITAYRPINDSLTFESGRYKYRYTGLNQESGKIFTVPFDSVLNLDFDDPKLFKSIKDSSNYTTLATRDKGYVFYQDSIDETNRNFILSGDVDIYTKPRIIEEKVHFRDGSIQGYDTFVTPDTVELKDGTVYLPGDTIGGVWKIPYSYRKLIPGECPGDVDTIIWEKFRGPAYPNFVLQNTDGCRKRDQKAIRVGYLSDIWLSDNILCKGEENEIRLFDSLMYWNVNTLSPVWPIDPQEYWDDLDRLQNQSLESKKVNWGEKGNDTYEFQTEFFHYYDAAGLYFAKLASYDSLHFKYTQWNPITKRAERVVGHCYDTISEKVYITDVIADFENPSANNPIPCDGDADFFNSSLVLDPCLTDICPGGTPQSCDEVIKYVWDFGDGRPNGDVSDPSRFYTQGGKYKVTLYVETKLGCRDTFSDSITIEGPKAEAEFTNSLFGTDTAVICLGDSVSLENTSIYSSEDVTKAYQIDWGDGKSEGENDAKFDELKHAYVDSAGVYFVDVIITEEKNAGDPCPRLFPDTANDLIEKRRLVVIVIDSAEIGFTMSDTLICLDQLIDIVDTSDDLFTTRKWIITDKALGTIEDSFSTDLSRDFPITSSNTGLKTISLSGEYKPIDPRYPFCVVKETSKDFRVIETKAYFSIDKSDEPTFCFKDSSFGAVEYQWDFNVDDTSALESNSTEQNPCYEYKDTGDYLVCLVVTSESPPACRDTVCDTLSYRQKETLVPYNVFTPEGDQFNNTFKVKHLRTESFEMIIYNRWGEKVFETTNPDEGWDGTVMNKGTNDCPQGVYYYIVNYKFRKGDEEKIEGQVTLLR